MEIPVIRQQDINLNKTIQPSETDGKAENIKLPQKAETINIPQNTAETIKDLLSGLGIKSNGKNMEMVLNLLNNNMPVNKENVQKLNQAMKFIQINTNNGEKTAENISSEKAIFILKNDMPVSQLNTLERFLKEDTSILKNLEKLLMQTDDLNNNRLKTQIKDILYKDLHLSDKETQEILVLEKISIAPPLQKNEMPTTSISNKQLEIITSKDNLIEIVPNNTNKESLAEIISNGSNGKISKEYALKTLNENKLPLTEKNITDLFSKHTEDSNLKTQIKQLFTDSEDNLLEHSKNNKDTKPSAENKNIQNKEIVNKFLLSLEKGKPQDIDAILKNLNGKMTKIQETIYKNGNTNQEILKTVTDFKENLSFINQIKTCVYMPIPFTLNNTQNQGELYVFNHKQKKKTGSSSSALIALNTANLGRIETYVQKAGRNLNLQFRLENESVKTLIRKNIGKLENLLKENNLSITSLNIINLETAFNLLSKEPNDVNKNSITNIEEVTFDLRA